MNKKGFTLIEIIISISLIILISCFVFIGVKYLNKKRIVSFLKSKENEIYNATNIYIENNNDIKQKIYNSKNPVVVPLNFIKNKGLIDFGNLNINDQYILVTLGSEIRENACIDTTIVGTWEKEDDTIIYLCSNLEVPLNELNNRIDELEERIDSISTTNVYNIVNMFDYIARGDNPNNHVKVVKGNKTSKWRIIEINEGIIKIIGNEDKLLITPSNYFTTLANHDENYNRGPLAIENKKLDSEYISNNLITLSTYSVYQNDDYGHYGRDFSALYYYKSYIGLVPYGSLINAGNVNGNWLHKLLSKYEMTFGYYINSGLSYLTESEMAICYSGCSDLSRKIEPVLTLKDTVKLKTDNSCSSTHKVGSESCPYIIES